MTGEIQFDGTFFRGRVALKHALECLEIGRGDEVILQAYTCVAVPEGIIAAGATPCFVDVIYDGVTMSPGSLESAITENTKAIIVQHTFGICADMAAIDLIAKRHNLPIIEDCAHTYWSEFDGQRVGTFGTLSFYSLEWGKPLAVGVGGGLISNRENLREEISERSSALSRPSLIRDLRLRLQYFVFTLAYGPRTYWHLKRIYEFLSKFGAAEKNFNDLELGVSEDFNLKLTKSIETRLMERLKNFRPDWVRNQQLTETYRNVFENVPSWKPIAVYKTSRTMYQRFPFWVDDKKRALAAARASNFELSDWFESAVDPLDETSSHVVGYVFGSCPNAERAAKHVVSLPMGLKGDITTLEKPLKKLAATLAKDK